MCERMRPPLCLMNARHDEKHRLSGLTRLSVVHPFWCVNKMKTKQTKENKRLPSISTTSYHTSSLLRLTTFILDPLLFFFWPMSIKTKLWVIDEHKRWFSTNYKASHFKFSSTSSIAIANARKIYIISVIFNSSATYLHIRFICQVKEL